MAFDARGQVVQHGHFYRGDASGLGRRKFRLVAAVHHPHRQIEHQVRQLGAGDLLDQFFQLWPHPGQGADIGEQREQNRGPHGGTDNSVRLLFSKAGVAISAP